MAEFLDYHDFHFIFWGERLRSSKVAQGNELDTDQVQLSLFTTPLFSILSFFLRLQSERLGHAQVLKVPTGNDKKVRHSTKFCTELEVLRRHEMLRRKASTMNEGGKPPGCDDLSPSTPVLPPPKMGWRFPTGQNGQEEERRRSTCGDGGTNGAKWIAKKAR